MLINVIFCPAKNYTNISNGKKSCTSRGQLRWDEKECRQLMRSFRCQCLVTRANEYREGLMKWNETESIATFGCERQSKGNGSCVLLWKAATLQHHSNLERMAPLRHKTTTTLERTCSQSYSQMILYCLSFINMIYHCDTLWTLSIESVQFTKKCTQFTVHIERRQWGRQV